MKLTLFVILSAAALFTICYAHHVGKYDGLGPRWAQRRSKVVSNKGPMVHALNTDVRAQKSVLSLLSHFEEVGNEMKRLRHESYSHTSRLVVCNTADNSIPWYFVSSRLRIFGMRWFRSSCITELIMGNANNILNNIRIINEVLEQKRLEIVRQSRVGWNNAFQFNKFQYDAFAQNCSLYHIPALRLQSKWALLTSMTEYEVDNNTASRSRSYLEELVSASNNQLINLPITVESYTGINSTGTTIVSNWSGIPSSTLFGVVPGFHAKKLGDNPAIGTALLSSSKWLEQVAASFNIANISVMALSCVIAFIPLSMFCEAKLHVIFLYVLFTDVFACAPLAVKGIELMDFSERLHQAVVTRIYGLDYELDLGVAEMWVATCSAPVEVRTTGVKFVTFAVVAMTAGVVAEMLALYRLQILKKRIKKNLTHTKTPHFMDRWCSGVTTCSECFCTHSLTHHGTRELYKARKFFFRIPSGIYQSAQHCADR